MWACPSAGRDATRARRSRPRSSASLNGRQRRRDARVVGDRAVLDRDVEVDAHERAPTRADRSRSAKPNTWPSVCSGYKHSLQQIDAAARVSPLVVVPRQHLDEVAVHHLGVVGVDDRRMRVAAEVDRHERRLFELQDARSAARRPPPSAPRSPLRRWSSSRPARRDRRPRRSASARASRCRRACP